MHWKNPDERRITSAWLVLLGFPGFVFCGLAHICMDGHMAHPPYAAWHYAIDVLWVCCFLAATVIGWNSNLILRCFLCYSLPLFCTTRLITGSFGGLTLLLELPLSSFVAVVAFRSLKRSGFDPSIHAEAEQVQHKKYIKRRLVFTFFALLAVILLIGAGLLVWQFVRVSRVPRVALSESSLPFAYELSPAANAGVWLTLPNGKRVALWREDYSVYPEWGERPYHEPRRIWTEESKGFRTSDRVKSYMQMGVDSKLSTETNRDAFSLFINDYCIAWPLARQTNNNRRILLTVRHAEVHELDYLQKRYGKWPLFD
jgi:hypothetical protein